jgi:hypothetical protein
MVALIVSLLLGIGLYAAPDALGYDGAARVSHLITGAIVASVSLIAIADVARELRWVNLLLGAWLVLSVPLIDHDRLALAVAVSVGVPLTLLAVVRGRINQRLGGGWRAVVWTNQSDNSVKGGTDEPGT